MLQLYELPVSVREEIREERRNTRAQNEDFWLYGEERDWLNELDDVYGMRALFKYV